MDYRARMYDPLLGRFVQPDTIIPDLADPQSWNRYSYVQNDPVTLVDPTGHFVTEDADCTKLSCSGDPGYARRQETARRRKEQREAIIAQIEETVRSCARNPVGYCPEITPGVAGPASAGGGYSDPTLESLFGWYEKVVSPFNDIVSAEDLYRLSSKGGWKAVRNGLNLTIIEGIVQAGRQAYRDSWYESLSLQQRVLRVLVAGGEGMGTDIVAEQVGLGFGGAGLVAGGPLGAAGGYLGGNTFATKVMDRFWTTQFNPLVLSQLGAWP